MRIGLLSDTHDRLDAARALMRRMADEHVSVVLHAGDYCAPFTVRAIAEFQIPLLGVFGNNDGDREALTAAAHLGIGSELYASPHSFEVGGKQLLVVHDLADVHERSIMQHRVVVHGGTHTAEMRSRGDTLIVNPGEGCGWLFGEPTGAILDLDTNVVEFIKLTGSEWKTA